MRIGIDFDNTLICYDQVFSAIAAEMGLPNHISGKRGLRETLRSSLEGDLAWQRVQGFVYGPRLMEAMPMVGAKFFLALCRERGATVSIVSHKTEYANYDPTLTPLRQAATRWLEAHGFFDRLGLDREAVHYEATRSAKVARIERLGIDIFIDDLEEVFAEPGFPARTRAILFHPGPDIPKGSFEVFDSFEKIGRAVFSD